MQQRKTRVDWKFEAMLNIEIYSAIPNDNLSHIRIHEIAHHTSFPEIVIYLLEINIVRGMQSIKK